MTSAAYSDSTVPEGLLRFYKVAAVGTDFSQSNLSEAASAAALDGTAPVIQHTPPASPITLPVPGLTIQSSITDNIAVNGATLFWRVSGGSAYTSAAMLHPSGNLYSCNIPGEYITLAGLDYYIMALDTVGNQAFHGTPESPHHLDVASQWTLTPSPTATPSPTPFPDGWMVW